MTDHKRIWLEPEAEVYGPDEGRLWCQDNVWDDDAVEYVLASAAKDEIARLTKALIHAAASLAAAISLLERSPKTGAASSKMFDIMLNDYGKALDAARDALEPETRSATDATR